MKPAAEKLMPRQSRMKRGTVALTLIVAFSLVFMIVWSRRERAAEQAALDEAFAASKAGSSTPTTTPPAGAAGSTEKVRKLDKPGRTALLERIQTARNSRAGGVATASSAAPRPALPALAGTISKDDIRAGVRAVIPLLAECYDAAQGRLSIKEGKIIVQMHLSGEPDVGTLIEKAEIEGDAHFTKDAELVECLQQTMLSVELPPIEGGGTIDITYPIAFAPG